MKISIDNRYRFYNIDISSFWLHVGDNELNSLPLRQGWGEYQICKYKYEYLQYVWVRVWVLDYYMSMSTSTGWWVRVPAYDLHSI